MFVYKDYAWICLFICFCSEKETMLKDNVCLFDRLDFWEDDGTHFQH